MSNNNQQINISGTWNTNRLPITFYQHGNKVLGRFDLNEALFEGTLQDNVLTGFWLHPYQSVYGPCNYGRLRFVFTGDRFEGYATFCDTEIPSDVLWTGFRRRDFP